MRKNFLPCNEGPTTLQKNLLVFFPHFSTKSFFETHNQSEWEVISASDMAQKGITRILRLARKKKWLSFCFGRADVNTREVKFYLQGILLIARAKNKYLVDNKGSKLMFSMKNFLFYSTPRALLELVIAPFIIVANYIALSLLFVFFKATAQRKFRHSESSTIAFCRTDNFGAGTIGGSFTHTEGFLQGIEAAEYKMFFLGPQQLFQSKKPLQLAKIPYITNMNSTEIPEILYGWKFFWYAWRILRNQHVAFLYHRHGAFIGSTPLLARLLRRPLFLEYNGSETWVKEKWGRLFLRSLCYAFEKVSLLGADRIAVVSDVLRDDLIAQGIPDNKIIVNPNGVNTKIFHPGIRGEKVRESYGVKEKILIGFIGSFGPWHGVDILAQSIKPILKLLPDAHFLIIGDGALRGYIEKKLHEDNIVSHVTMTGLIPHDESPEYLGACDILVSPHVPNLDGTRFFGSPTKLFEYMAMGRGIVASDLEQIGKVLEHERTALLVKPGDVGELVAGVVRLAHDKQLRERLGTQARIEVEKNYTWEMNAKRILDAYEGL